MNVGTWGEDVGPGAAADAVEDLTRPIASRSPGTVAQRKRMPEGLVGIIRALFGDQAGMVPGRSFKPVARQNSDLLSNQADELRPSTCETGLMLCMLRLLSILSVRIFCSRRDLLLENLALRQQLAVLTLKHPQPQLAASEKLFWVVLRWDLAGLAAGIDPGLA